MPVFEPRRQNSSKQRRMMAIIDKNKNKGETTLSTNGISELQKREPFARGRPYLLAAVTFALVILIAIIMSLSPSSPTGGIKSATEHIPVPLMKGTSSNGIPYYYCGYQNDDDESLFSPHYQLVLLHGARFTKEDWVTSGIIKKLCHGTSFPSTMTISVMALDLPIRATFQDLVTTLKALEQQNNVPSFRLPISALVTPSASGFVMANYMSSKNGDNDDELSSILQSWIPIAPPAVKTLSSSELELIKDLHILAIYGDQDKMGKQVSLKLKQEAKAEVVIEIKGRHPCYFDSPDAFCQHVFDFLSRLPTKGE